MIWAPSSTRVLSDKLHSEVAFRPVPFDVANIVSIS